MNNNHDFYYLFNFNPGDYCPESSEIIQMNRFYKWRKFGQRNLHNRLKLEMGEANTKFTKQESGQIGS